MAVLSYCFCGHAADRHTTMGSDVIPTCIPCTFDDGWPEAGPVHIPTIVEVADHDDEPWRES